MTRLALAVALLLGLAACETMKGFGRDVQSAGRTVESGAYEAEDELKK